VFAPVKSAATGVGLAASGIAMAEGIVAAGTLSLGTVVTVFWIGIDVSVGITMLVAGACVTVGVAVLTLQAAWMSTTAKIAKSIFVPIYPSRWLLEFSPFLVVEL
jgi:hypothetical protein